LRDALLLTAGTVTVACGGTTGQFYVVQNQVPGPGCVIPTTKGGLYQGSGVLDVRVPAASDAAYLLMPLLQNDLPAEDDMGAEPNRIALTGFEVDIRFVDGSGPAGEFFAQLAADPGTAALLHYQTAWSGSVAPGGGNTAAMTTAFPAETARRLRDSKILADGSLVRVNAQLRAAGRKLTGGVKSDVFTYPIEICDGCLIHSVTTCPAAGAVLKGGICNPGQDAPVDCCTQGADLLCPATAAP
jgi:hypothetical protein